jgi:hypothetical protein
LAVWGKVDGVVFWEWGGGNVGQLFDSSRALRDEPVVVYNPM